MSAVEEDMTEHCGPPLVDVRMCAFMLPFPQPLGSPYFDITTRIWLGLSCFHETARLPQAAFCSSIEHSIVFHYRYVYTVHGYFA